MIFANGQVGKSDKIEPYYTNSTQLPVGHTDDFFEALDLQEPLQIKYTGGTVLHGFLGERINDIETTKKLVENNFFKILSSIFHYFSHFQHLPVARLSCRRA